MQILLDTNVVLEHSRSNILSDYSSDIQFIISVITEAELLRYAGLSVHELQLIEDFLRSMMLVSVNSKIARRAAFLGRTRKTRLPDLLIAATALELEIPLITRNVKDFRNIPGLVLRKEV